MEKNLIGEKISVLKSFPKSSSVYGPGKGRVGGGLHYAARSIKLAGVVAAGRGS